MKLDKNESIKIINLNFYPASFESVFTLLLFDEENKFIHINCIVYEKLTTKI